jgi:hypothetical protein
MLDVFRPLSDPKSSSIRIGCSESWRPDSMGCSLGGSSTLPE